MFLNWWKRKRQRLWGSWYPPCLQQLEDRSWGIGQVHPQWHQLSFLSTDRVLLELTKSECGVLSRHDPLCSELDQSNRLLVAEKSAWQNLSTWAATGIRSPGTKMMSWNFFGSILMLCLLVLTSTWGWLVCDIISWIGCSNANDSGNI